MQRISHKTASTTLPPISLGDIGDPGYFQVGSPGESPATVVTPEFLNSIQEEIANVIEKTGEKLDITNNSQLYDAIKKNIDNESNRAQAAEANMLPLTGGNVHGPVMVDATFTDDTGKTLTQPIGAISNSLQFYLQIADDPKASTTYGRLIIKDGDGNFTTILQGDNHGNLTNYDGKALALQEDVAADVANERARAQAAEEKLLPISGGTLKGALYADGNFTDANGQILSQPNGNAIGNNQFYSQLAQDRSGKLFGRLIMKHKGVWTHVLECTPDGHLSNINGKSLALIDDVANAEAQLFPLSGGNVHGPVLVDSTFTDDTGKTLSQPIGATFKGLQYYLQIADDPKAKTTYGRLIIKNRSGAFITILQGDNHGNLTNFEGNTLPVLQSAQSGGDQVFWVNAMHGDWISFPKPFQNFWTDGTTSNVYITITPSSPWGDDNDFNNNNTLVATIDRTNSGQTLNMTNAGFRVRLNQFYTAKKNHSRSDYRGTPAWLCVRAVCI